MRIPLLPEKGNFYKVNMHCHTTISDGKCTPEQVKEQYLAQGYSAVCYTDHEVLVGHEDLCDEHFIALHGYEVAIKQDPSAHTGVHMPVYHFNLIAERQDQRLMPRFFRDNPSCAGAARHYIDTVGVFSEDDLIFETRYDVAWLNDYLGAIRRAGYLVNYNHPQWSLNDKDDYSMLTELDSIELINGSCSHLGDNTPLVYEALLRLGRRFLPTGGDDNHSRSQCGLGWTVLCAPELTYDALIAAYKAGDLYVSEGPSILALYYEDGEICVRTTPAVSIVLRGEGRYSVVRQSRTEQFTEVRLPYDPQRLGAYLRIEVRDPEGYKAYSRAYFTDDPALREAHEAWLCAQNEDK